MTKITEENIVYAYEELKQKMLEFLSELEREIPEVFTGMEAVLGDAVICSDVGLYRSKKSYLFRPQKFQILKDDDTYFVKFRIKQ